MKKRTHKLLSLLLTLVMVLGMLPAMSITALADYEDGMDCLACGHYHWDDHVCGMCGLCSEECNTSCWEEFHCQYGCGACYLEIDYWCPDCGLCEDCMETTDFHCKECRACLQPEDICQDCGKCEDCVGWLCMDCGQCDECSDDFHCEECGGCYQVNGWEHGTHCADCCEICEQCGECIIQNETEFCYECGLCEACCEENRADSDCSCGEYCVESVEFEEHFCEFCGACFDGVDQCELCYLCADCCADNSDCSEGLCVEDPDYEEHFCEDCGTCFCEAAPCETCADEGELRCVYCCESLASSYGCDCGDVCSNDPDFEEHLLEVHPEDGEIGEHTAKPQIGWSMNDTDHWHGCRLCSEDAHITDKANHTYDKYGVCTVCGFKQGAPVFITHQPKDVYAKVTDINADADDPLYWKNNTVSFKVTAYGEKLTYQWYRVADGGTPTPLTTSDPRLPSYGEGATTDKVTVSVPGDACTTVYTFYCVVKDKDGNTATSNAARIKAGHVYAYCQNVATGSEKTIYVKSGETFETKKYQDTEGHYWSCCGEEDFGDGVTDFGNTRTKAPVSHNYGNQELIQATKSYSDAQAGTFSTYYRYTCADCGHQIYVEKHIHDFKCPVPGTEENNAYLEEHCTPLTHPLVCTVAGCTETRTEQHEWQAWRIANYPTAERPGGMRRECLYCEYQQYKDWTDKNGDPVQWTTANMLVSASYGTANRSLAAPGDKVTLTPKQTAGKKCTGWKADYTDYSGETPVTKTVSVTVSKNADGTWSCTVPSFAAMDVNGGGQLGFEAQFETCSHTSGTRTEGYRTPVCTRSGYTGDKVCVDCGKILEGGDPIPGGTEHEGTLTLVPGTKVEADCTHRGYTGDFTCDACGGIVAGERTGYDHGDEDNYYLRDYVTPTCTTEGYTGDEYCNTCHKLLAHGKVLPIQHSTRTNLINAAYASCTDSGYTGDTKCLECGQIFKMGKTIHPLGHRWDEGVLLKEATVTERGEMLYTCTKKPYVAGEGYVDCGATKIEYIPRLSDTTVDVTAAEVSVTAPVKGKAPANATASGGQFTVANTAWEPVPGSTFAADTVYSVVVTLEANEGYRFTSATAFKVNGSAATIVTRSTQEAKISFTFPATASSGSSGSSGSGSSGSGSGSGSSGSSSGGSGVSTYAITVASAKHGSVTASDKTAAKGDTVTLTVKPDKDYALDTLTVTDGSGDELKLKEKNGKYTFTMPASKVTVKAAFAAVKAEQPVAVNPFTDVAEGAYYYDAVQWAVGQGITKGTTETTFSPGNTCTRAQIITFLWRASGSPEPKGACTFTDVPAGSYFEKAVAWAAEQGMASGDKFAPYDPCTRLMAVEFMWKQAGSPTAPAAAFTDVSSDAVNWALEKGVTKGTTDTTFAPGNTCTRAQIVTFLWRAFAE